METQARTRAQRPLAVVVRVAIGAAVLAFVVLRDPGALLDALARANALLVVAAAAVLLVGLCVSALRWRAYLEALEIPLRWRTLLRMYFVGTFFNAFLPTGVGGDAYKAVRIGRANSAGARAFASVFLDRFAGLVGMALVGMLGVVVELVAGRRTRVAGVSLVLCAAVLAGATLLLVAGDRFVVRFIPDRRWGAPIRRAMRAIHETARHPVAAARGYALGVGYQALLLVEHLLLARALGVEQAGVGALAGVMVIAQVATLVPLTINGLGFREAGYVWALSAYGVQEGPARAFAVVVLAILLATSVIGGIAYVVAGGDVSRER